MNTQVFKKSMNSMTSLSDGEITIEDGAITFSDGSVLDSIENITLLNADNIMTGDNTFDNVIVAPTAPILDTHLTNLGSVNTAIATETARLLADDNSFTGTNFFDNNIFSLALAPEFDSNLTRKDYVDMSILSETTRLLTVDNIFTGNNTFNYPITAPVSAPLLSTHLTNKAYVDGAIATETASILASNNTFTGDNTFDNNITTLAEIPILDSHLTNKSYVDEKIANETTSILASDNTFTGDNTFSGISTITNTTPSTTATTGSLVVSGGVGIAENLNVNGKINNLYLVKKNNGYMIGNDTFTSTTGSYNNALGLNAGKNITSGEGNNAIGYNSLYSNSTGRFNTAIGDHSGGINSSGSYNSFLGYFAGALTDGLSNSTAIGARAKISDSNQVVLGQDTVDTYVKIPSTKASTTATTGALVVGGGVGISGVLNVDNMVRLKKQTDNKKLVLYDLNTDDLPADAIDFYGFGIKPGVQRYQVPYTDTTSHEFYNGADLNLSIKDGAVMVKAITPSSTYQDGALVVSGGVGIAKDLRVNGITTTTTIENTTINGVRVKAGITNNQYTIVVDDGSSDLTNLSTSGMENFIFGKLNMTSYTGTGTQNIAVGLQNLQGITTQSYNTAVGCNVFKDTTGGYNTGIGNNVFRYATTGSYNVGVGFDVGRTTETGSNNVMVGYLSGLNSYGSNNTFIGYRTQTNSGINTYDNSTAIGQSATITASNQMVLGVSGTGLTVNIPSTKTSSSATNGALVVAGGVGISGALNVSGVLKITPNKVNNKMLVLYDASPSEPLVDATSFYGFGIDGGILRYQTPVETDHYHEFYCSTTLQAKIGNGTLTIPSTTDSTSPTTGVLQIAGGAGIAKNIVAGGMIKTLNSTNNKKIVLQDAGSGDNPLNATAFFGFGINTSTLRYQTHTEAQYHRFYNGNDFNFEVGNKAVTVKTDLNVDGNCDIGGMFSAQLFNSSAGYTLPAIGSEFTFTSGTKILIINFSCYATTQGKKTMTFQLTGSSLSNVKQTFTQSFYMNQTGSHMSYSFSFKTNNLITTTNDTIIRGFVDITGIVKDTNDYLQATIFNTGSSS